MALRTEVLVPLIWDNVNIDMMSEGDVPALVVPFLLPTSHLKSHFSSSFPSSFFLFLLLPSPIIITIIVAGGPCHPLIPFHRDRRNRNAPVPARIPQSTATTNGSLLVGRDFTDTFAHFSFFVADGNRGASLEQHFQ